MWALLSSTLRRADTESSQSGLRALYREFSHGPQRSLGGRLTHVSAAPAMRRRSLRLERVTRVRPPGQRLVQRPPRLRQLRAQSSGFQRPVGPAFVERRIREGPLQLGYPSFGGEHRLFKALGFPLRRPAGLLRLAPRGGGLPRLRSCGLRRSRFLSPPRPVPGGLLRLLPLPLDERSTVIVDPLAVEGPHPGCQLAQEGAVVAHQDDRALVVLQSVLQRLDGLHIQIVGRLVQYHEVRRSQCEERQGHARPFTARQGRRVALHVVPGKTEAAEVILNVASGPATPHLGNALVDGLVLGNLSQVLPKPCCFDAGPEACGAGRRLVGAEERGEERGLASAVRAYQRDHVAAPDNG